METSKTKTKFKEFWEENGKKIGKEATRMLYLAAGIGIGYFVGDKIATMKCCNGISVMFAAKPEMKNMFWEAADICAKEIHSRHNG